MFKHEECQYENEQYQFEPETETMSIAEIKQLKLEFFK